MTERLLALLDFAQILAKSERTVRRMINEGEIPAYRIGASLRVRESDVEAFIESRKLERPAEDLKALVQRAVERAHSHRRGPRCTTHGGGGTKSTTAAERGGERSRRASRHRADAHRAQLSEHRKPRTALSGSNSVDQSSNPAQHSNERLGHLGTLCGVGSSRRLLGFNPSA